LVHQMAGAGIAQFQTAQSQVSAALAKAIPYQVTGPAVTNATGLSLYFPSQAQEYNDGYNHLAGVDGWRGFLNSYLNVGAASLPKFLGDNNIKANVANGVFTFRGDLVHNSGGDITQATFVYGVADSSCGAACLYGEGPAEVSNAADTVTGSWNLTVAKFTQGQLWSYGYFQQERGTNGVLTNSIPFKYQADPTSLTAQPQDAIRRVSFDGSGKLVEDTYYLVVNGSFGELATVPGSTLTPVIRTLDASKAIAWNPTTISFSAADLTHNPIAIAFEVVPANHTVEGILAIQPQANPVSSSYVDGTAAVP
jgi:hypothetical protein